MEIKVNHVCQSLAENATLGMLTKHFFSSWHVPGLGPSPCDFEIPGTSRGGPAKDDIFLTCDVYEVNFG